MAKREIDTNHPTSTIRSMVFRTMFTYLYAVVISLIPMIIGTRFFSEPVTRILTTAVGMVVLFVLMYSTFWNTAERDRNLVIYGHLKENRLRGLQGSILGSIPLFLIILLVVIDAYAPFLPDIPSAILRILLMPFLFFLRAATDVPSFFSWTLILLVAIIPAAAWWGYRNGYTLVRLLDKLVYKQKPRSKDKRLR